MRFGHFVLHCTICLDRQHQGSIGMYTNSWLSYRNNCYTKLRFSRLLIATLNFECSNHVDKVDTTTSFTKGMMDDLKTIMEDPYINGSWLEQARNAWDYLNWHDASVPTTCCYQFLSGDNDVEIFQKILYSITWHLLPD